MSHPPPLHIAALSPATTSALVWQTGTVRRVTLILKATFRLVHEGAMQVVQPLPIVTEDRLAAAPGSAVESSEIAPFLPGADVIVRGHAHAPGGRAVRSMQVRFGVFRGRWLLDKTLHVFGDRRAGGAAPLAFQRMPIVYERAYGGPGVEDNPVGVGGTPDDRRSPNVVDPKHPARPAGFGPIARVWPARRRAIAREPAFEGFSISLPDGFPYRYFHAAPPDQQIEQLFGDEWLVVEGMHPELPHLSTRLPSARGVAMRYRNDGRREAPRPVPMVADTLAVDMDNLLATLVFRGNFTLDPGDTPASFRAFAGVELPDQPIEWPHLDDLVPPAPRVVADAVTEDEIDELGMTAPMPRRVSTGPALPFAPAAKPALDPGEATQGFTIEEIRARANRPIAPFRLAAPGSKAPRNDLTIPGAPWGPPASRPPSVRFDAMFAEEATHDASAPLDVSEPSAPPPGEPSSPVPPPFMAPPPAAAPPPVVVPPPALARRPLLILGAPMPPAAAPTPPPSVPPPAFAPMPPPPVLDLTASPAAAIAPPPSLSGASTPPKPASLGPILPAPEPPKMTALGPPKIAEPVPEPPKMAAPEPPKMAAPEPPKMAAPEPPKMATMSAEALGPSKPALPLRDDSQLHGSAAAVVAPAASAAAAPALGAAGGRDVVVARLASGEPLRGLDLAGADLRDLDLRRAVLAEVHLRGANLANAKLEGADLTGADLSNADLSGADLTRAALTRADLRESRLCNANLTEANLERANCTGTDFEGARLSRANLQRATADGANFSHAFLDGADLRHARLVAATLDHADLRDIEAARCDLSRASFAGSKLAGAQLRSARLREVVLKDASLEGADLRDVDLERSDLRGASLRGAKLAGANLRDAVE